MARAKLKTQEQIEQERLEAARYALGNIVLDITKLLLIYARQSTSKQYVSNIYSAMEQRDGLLERASDMGWTRDEQRILYVENQLAKKTHVSGALRIDQRVGLQALTEVILKGLASAVLVVSVDRITRDPDMITPVQFANLCKEHKVLIITDDYIYDFNNPNRDDMGRFMNEAIASKEYVRKQIKGKMLKNRTRKANMGLVANGAAPVGLMMDMSALDEKGKPYNLTPSPHQERVGWLYGRFRALDANLGLLLREVIDMAKRGEALFPDDERIDPKSIHLKRMPNETGWTVSSRIGLKYILTNPMYVGHLVWDGRIVKRNAHPAIVDQDLWDYAYEHLADVDLDGQPIEREARAVRYTQQTGVDSGALMAGIRDNGRLVIDGVGGVHVYVHMPDNRYHMKQWVTPTVSGYETGIYTKELDRMLESRLLHWLNVADRRGADWLTIDERVQGDYLVSSVVKAEHTPLTAMRATEQNTQVQPESTLAGDLALTIKDLARVERRLRTSEDLMDDSELRETYASKARLIKRKAELERAIDRQEKQASRQAQAKEDIETARVNWHTWPLEKKRSFIRMVTDAITLEELADGWLRFSLVWSALMGFVSPETTTQQAVDVAFIWRASGNYWSDEDRERLSRYYPTASRDELMRMFPSRSWHSIMQKAKRWEIRREVVEREALPVPKDVSLSDLEVVREYGLEPGEHVQWYHYHFTNDLTIS
jgi:hypothetical protein